MRIYFSKTRDLSNCIAKEKSMNYLGYDLVFP